MVHIAHHQTARPEIRHHPRPPGHARPVQDMRRWQDWSCMGLGIAMAVSPWLLGYTGLQDATLNAVIIGFLTFALSALALTLLDRWEAYINALLGIWLLLSPWLLRFEDFGGAKFAHLAIGAFILVIAILEIWQTRPVSHGS